MIRLINALAALLVLAVSAAFAQTSVEEVFARAEFARQSSQDVTTARSLYETLDQRGDLSPALATKVQLGLGHCHAVLGQDDAARGYFERAAKGEGEAAQEAKELLATGNLNVDPQLAARVRRALDIVRTGKGGQVGEAKRSLVLLGAPAIPIVAREAQIRCDDSGFVRAIVQVMAEVGGKAAADFFRTAVKSEDDYYRRAVITGVVDSFRLPGSNRGLQSSPIREVVHEFLLDKDEYVRGKATDFAFSAISMFPSAELILKAADHPESSFRRRIHELNGKSYRGVVGGGLIRAHCWVSSILGTDKAQAARYLEDLRRDLTHEDQDLRKAAMESLQSSLSGDFSVDTYFPLFVETIVEGLQKSPRGAIKGLEVGDMRFQIDRFVESHRSLALDAVERIAAVLGQTSVDARGLYPNRWEEWFAQGIGQILGRTSIRLPLRHQPLVLDLARRGFTPRQALSEWLKKSGAEGYADGVLDALPRIGLSQELLRLKGMTDASDEAVRRFVPLAQEAFANSGTRSISAEARSVIALVCSSDSKARTEIILETCRTKPKFYPVLANAVQNYNFWNLSAAIALLGEGENSEEHATARNRLFFGLLFFEDPRIAGALVKAYDRGLPATVAMPDRDDHPRDRGLANLAYRAPQSRGPVDRNGNRPQVATTSYNSGRWNDPAAFLNGEERLRRLLRTGNPQVWDDARFLLRGQRTDLKGQEIPQSTVTQNGHRHSSSYRPEKIRALFANIILEEREHAPDEVQGALDLDMLHSAADDPSVVPTVRAALARTEDSEEVRRLRRAAVLNFHLHPAFKGSEEIVRVAIEQDRRAEKGEDYSLIVKYFPADKIELLAPLLKSKNSRNRQRVAERLIETRGTKALDLLLPLFEDPSSSIRLMMIKNAVQIADERVIPAIVERLLDESEKCRKAARTNLDQLTVYFAEKKRWADWGGTSPVEIDNPLATLSRQALKEKDQTIRMAAVQSLRTLGDPKALPVLIELMKDADKSIADAAKMAVAALNRR